MAWVEYDGDFVHIHRMCPFCHKAGMVTILEKQYHWWQDGMAIQNAMPDVSPGDREFLKSGIHSTCWDAEYPPDEEDVTVEHDPGGKVDDEGGMSEHRHLPTSEEW